MADAAAVGEATHGDGGDHGAEPSRSPLFEAEHAARYERQQLIGCYEREHSCRLAVLIGQLAPFSVTAFEDLLFDADPAEDLHLILDTPGGDGETAIRLVRQVQSRCRKFIVIVPNQAKSAGTLLALGADRILMGPTGDLGPIDPQLLMKDGSRAAAKAIVAAADRAEQIVRHRPEDLALQALLLQDLNALKIQQARDALSRADSLLREALESRNGSSAEEVDELAPRLKHLLIDEPPTHGAVIPANTARDHGMPVSVINPNSPQWRSVWRLWTRYYALAADYVFEGSFASRIHRLREADPTRTLRRGPVRGG